MSRKVYDFAKAKQLIEDHKESITSASLGMHEDWFWTAETVYENGVYVQNLDEIKIIGGINGSDWATPTLQLCYKNGEEDMVEVSIGSQNVSFGEKIAQQAFWVSGCLSSEVQENIKPLKTD